MQGPREAFKHSLKFMVPGFGVAADDISYGQEKEIELLEEESGIDDGHVFEVLWRHAGGDDQLALDIQIWNSGERSGIGRKVSAFRAELKPQK